jgi:hypothetical protein
MPVHPGNGCGCGIGYRGGVGKSGIPSRYFAPQPVQQEITRLEMWWCQATKFPAFPFGESRGVFEAWGVYFVRWVFLRVLCRGGGEEKQREKIINSLPRCSSARNEPHRDIPWRGARLQSPPPFHPVPSSAPERRAEHSVVFSPRARLLHWLGSSYFAFNTPSSPTRTGPAGIGQRAGG